MATSDERRFGRDLVLPPVGQAVQQTASGDWPTIAGAANLRSAHVRRAVTARGALTHRPDYGGDLPRFIERLADATTRAQAAVGVRDNALRDERIVNAEIAHSLPDDRDGAVIYDLRLQARGEVDAVTVSVTTE